MLQENVTRTELLGYDSSSAVEAQGSFHQLLSKNIHYLDIKGFTARKIYKKIKTAKYHQTKTVFNSVFGEPLLVSG